MIPHGYKPGLLHRDTCKMTQKATSLQMAAAQSRGVQEDFLMVFDRYTVLKGSHWQHMTTDRPLRSTKYDQRSLDLLWTDLNKFKWPGRPVALSGKHISQP